MPLCSSRVGLAWDMRKMHWGVWADFPDSHAQLQSIQIKANNCVLIIVVQRCAFLRMENINEALIFQFSFHWFVIAKKCRFSEVLLWCQLSFNPHNLYIDWILLNNRTHFITKGWLGGHNTRYVAEPCSKPMTQPPSPADHQSDPPTYDAASNSAAPPIWAFKRWKGAAH